MARMKKSLDINALTLKVQMDLLTRTMGVEWVQEYHFHPSRKWRFDVAFPSRKIGVEVQGGLWKYGRHNRPGGYEGDMAKHNAAAELGYRIFYFTWQQIGNGDAVRLLARVLTD
jgi:hypothetical protein